MSVKFDCLLTFAPIRTPVKIFLGNKDEGCHTFSMEGIFEYIAGSLLTKEKDTKDSPYNNHPGCPLCRGNIFSLKLDDTMLEDINNSSNQSNSPREVFTKDENTKKLYNKFVEVFKENKQITIKEMKKIRDDFLIEELVPDNSNSSYLNKKIFLYLSLMIVAAFVISFVNLAIYHIFFHPANYGISRNRIIEVIPRIGPFRNYRFPSSDLLRN